MVVLIWNIDNNVLELTDGAVGCDLIQFSLGSVGVCIISICHYVFLLCSLSFLSNPIALSLVLIVVQSVTGYS